MNVFLVKPVDGCIKEVSSKSVKESGEVVLKNIEPGKSMVSIMDYYISIQKNVYGVVSV